MGLSMLDDPELHAFNEELLRQGDKVCAQIRHGGRKLWLMMCTNISNHGGGIALRPWWDKRQMALEDGYADGLYGFGGVEGVFYSSGMSRRESLVEEGNYDWDSYEIGKAEGRKRLAEIFSRD